MKSELALALIVSMTQGAVAETVTIIPSKDNTLIESASGDVSNGSGPVLFVGNNSGETAHRAVLAFDIASAVPVPSTIDSVELRIHVSSVAPGSQGPVTVRLHRLQQDWGEGSSSTSGGSGAPSSEGDATWIHTFYPDSLWSAEGGDFGIEASGSAVLADTSFYFVADSVMASDVQDWLLVPEANFGWLLLCDESVPSTVRRIDSRENDIEENRPRLIIHYTPVIPTQRMTWGRIKSLRR